MNVWNKFYKDNPINSPRDFNILEEEYKKACLNGVYKKKDISWRMKVLQDFVLNSFYFDVYCRTRYQPKDSYRLSDIIHPGRICLPGKRRLYVNVGGIFYPCERVPSKDDYYIIGDVYNGIDHEKVKKMINDFTNTNIDDCKNCWIIRMCGIGCMKEFIKNGKSYADRKKRLCNLARENRHKEIINMCEILEEDPTALKHFDDVKVS